MTILVFDTISRLKSWTVATSDWTVTNAAHPDCIIILSDQAACGVSLPITMDEFLALIADGGKIVNLRELQQETNR